ncbi:GntR family transcriptional regulator [Oceanispirochaeta sp.]|jgi:DNA-binding GntR family transcriptional regulator|uniref:GntR family transcriptional regulator n=1 Tax=Oceanispirochaeta sp. TaxID=2035350 RepID=UPI00262C955C|nr:GntR family transcriptional regulator [Oceanispirochaeta sp.]MDA3956080.1 GntR family transcriptional regulator [Oceanispirochaeta sp.]
MSRISRDALGDLVYDQIVRMLLNHDLEPGEKILKKNLADVIGVSQTPINEAVSRLISEGIIEQKGRSGLFIRIFTNKDMMELFAVRAGLEGTALHLCMEEPENPRFKRVLNLFDDFSYPLPEERFLEYQKRDQEFHGEILKISGNRVILDFIRNFEFILRCYQKGLIRSPNETLMEHKSIVEAIRSGNTEQAQQLIMSHHWKTRERLKEMPES